MFKLLIAIHVGCIASALCGIGQSEIVTSLFINVTGIIGGVASGIAYLLQEV